MSPFLSSLIGAGARWLITVAAARGMAVSEDQANQIMLGAVTVVPLLWSWYQKYQADRKLSSAKAGV